MDPGAVTGYEASNGAHEPQLVVASNRLPIVLRRGEGGAIAVEAGQGGLARALAPLIARSGGTWIGWPGAACEELAPAAVDRALGAWPGLRGISLTREEISGYYAGFANSVLWPVFHGLAARGDFNAGNWALYQQVNRRFAEAIARVVGAGPAAVWIHDYHLLHVGAGLREFGVGARLGFFLHTPFPALDDLVKLPWRAELLRALLAHDVIGFQSARDLRRFLSCVEQLASGARIARRGACEATIRSSSRRAAVAGVFPIGIDPTPFQRARNEARVAAEARAIRASVGERTLLLGVDRLDYTKGLCERLGAFERALERFPELRGRIVLVQVVVPSREQVPAYARLKREVEREGGRISGRFATTEWEPVRYLYRALSPEQLLAAYREADIALVTPLADGMNLVAKEYCAAKLDRAGVLILSEMAGAASQLRGGAVLVNPYDEGAVAEAIGAACAMPETERRARMRKLCETVSRSDVHWWGKAFVSSLWRDEPVPVAAAEVLPTVELSVRARSQPPK